jgi:hypothetical protein
VARRPCLAACAHLKDVARAAVLHRLLVPYSDQLLVIVGVVIGSVPHYLGLLATTLGQFEEAEARFATADTVHARIGALPGWLERGRNGLGLPGPGDLDRARELLGQALDAARDLGLVTPARLEMSGA